MFKKYILLTILLILTIQIKQALTSRHIDISNENGDRSSDVKTKDKDNSDQLRGFLQFLFKKQRENRNEREILVGILIFIFNFSVFLYVNTC